MVNLQRIYYIEFLKKTILSIFTSLCNVNHRNYITSQSNDVIAVQDRKISHGCLALEITVLHR
jgi:hypothetical protein